MMKSLITAIFFVYCSAAFGSPLDNPRVTLNDILSNYQGSFRITYSGGGNATTAWQAGVMALNPGNNSIFVDSHLDENSVNNMVAEFQIPTTLETSTDPSQLPNASLLQPFTNVLSRASTPTTTGADRIFAMQYINGQLYIQAARWYAGTIFTNPADTSLVIRDPSNLSSSTVDGFFKMAGGERTVGYISPIPTEWQAILGGPYLTGNGRSGMAIDSRLSIGPSLYVFNPADLTGAGGSISTLEKQNYTVATAMGSTVHPLPSNAPHSVLEWDGTTTWTPWDWAPQDAFNYTGLLSGFAQKNGIWTAGSVANFGFIVPGTRTFAVFGSSGMHDSGGGYKIQQKSGRNCNGPCSYDPADNYGYYWLFDLKDIVQAGDTHSVVPYEYGKLGTRYKGLPSSAGFDPATGKLFIYIKNANQDVTEADNFGSGYPVVNVYALQALPPSSGKRYRYLSISDN